MYNLITLIANNGTEYRFMDEIIASSSMADVYFNKWHINNLTTSEDMFLYENRIPVGDFYLSNGKWYLRNLALDNLYDKDLNIKIEIGNSIELSNGKKILLSVEDGGRLVVVQLTNSAVEPRC